MVGAFYCWRKIIMSVVSKNEKNQPAPKLLPYGVADIKFLCQWYEKQAFWEIRCTDIKNICQYKKIKENHCSDIKRICQHQAKMNADVKMLCQDQKKWKKKHKIKAIDVKNKRQESKKIKVNGWGFLLLT